MIQHLIEALTGRRYDISYSDLEYIIKKGAGSYIRGLLWSFLRLQKSNGLMLGKNVRILGGRYLQRGSGVSIGANSYVDSFSRQGIHLFGGVTIREGAWIQCRSGLNQKGEGLEIRENTYIGPYAVIGVGGKIVIGKNVQAGARLTLSAESHVQGTSNFVDGLVNRKGIDIGDNVWIGNNVTILDGVTIGDNCVIGAGSLVRECIPQRSVAVGVPAKVIKTI